MCRFLDVDAEAALKAGTAKFERRFRAMETSRRSFAALSLDEKEVLWQQAKVEKRQSTLIGRKLLFELAPKLPTERRINRQMFTLLCFRALTLPRPCNHANAAPSSALSVNERVSLPFAIMSESSCLNASIPSPVSADIIRTLSFRAAISASSAVPLVGQAGQSCSKARSLPDCALLRVQCQPQDRARSPAHRRAAHRSRGARYRGHGR